MKSEDTPSSRMMPLEDLIPLLQSERIEGRSVVFTNGCFDLLHTGHVRYLEKAAQQGDLLVVGVNSDRSVRENKGDGRPVVGQAERAEVLAALRCVDYVVIFNEATPGRTIRKLQPDVLVKGGDWPLDQIVGRRTVEATGGRVLSIGFEEGHSTSAIIGRIRNS